MTSAPKDNDIPSAESIGERRPEDQVYWEKMLGILDRFDHSPRHIINLWPTYVRRLLLQRFIAHYELFKHVIELPGHVVELGVFRGSSFFTWAKLMETFCPCDRRRRVYGFDHFKGLRQFHPKDGIFDESDNKYDGGFDATPVREELLELIKLHNDDNLIPGFPRCHLVEGEIVETLPKFLEQNPGIRISLLHLDVDLYLPTKRALELLYPLVVKGGVVVFDEYGVVPWQGESTAADEYFKEIGEQPVIRKFPFSPQPHGYFIK